MFFYLNFLFVLVILFSNIYFILARDEQTWKEEKKKLRKILLVIFAIYLCYRSVAQMVKHLPAMQETWVQSLSWEDPLEKGMATHSSIPAWKIPWTEEPGGLQSMGSQRIGHD